MRRRKFASGLVGVSIPLHAFDSTIRHVIEPLRRTEIDTAWDFYGGILKSYRGEPYPIQKDTLQIHTINAGSGNSTLISTPKNTNILVDTGHFVDRGLYVKKYLKKHNVKEIEILVATHPHWDHIGGQDRLLLNYNSSISKVIDTGYKNDTTTYEKYNYQLNRLNRETSSPRRGDIIYEEDKLKIQVINPPDKKITRGKRFLNDNSYALKVIHGENSFILPADIEKSTERSLVNDKDIKLDCDMIRVPHHGSWGSSTGQFLNKTDPEVAIISSAYDSQYNRPHTDVLSRLEERDIHLYWTGSNGSIIAESNGSEWKLHKQQKSRYNGEKLRQNKKVTVHPAAGFDPSITDSI